MTIAGKLGANRICALPWIMTFVVALVAYAMGTIRMKMALLIALVERHVVPLVDVVLGLGD